MIIQLLMLINNNKKFQELYILESPTLTKLTSETHEKCVLTILNSKTRSKLLTVNWS